MCHFPPPQKKQFCALPAVCNGLDVGQQVHLESVALLEGLPALQEKRGAALFVSRCTITLLPPRQRLLTLPPHLHLVAHVGLLGTVGLHVLGEPLLHGVDPAADGAREGVPLGRLQRQEEAARERGGGRSPSPHPWGWPHIWPSLSSSSAGGLPPVPCSPRGQSRRLLQGQRRLRGGRSPGQLASS